MNNLNLTLIVVALAACTTAPHAPVVTPANGVSLTNPGFESTAPGRRNNDPEGWFSHQHAGEVSYKFALDTADPHGGTRSLRIDNIGAEPYGAIAQRIDAQPYRGKTLRLSGWLRTRDTANASLSLMVLANGVPLANNFMSDAPVKGTTAWNRYTITLPVAANAEYIEIGAMMQGKGTLWLDDVELSVQ
jgi:hypothetical protein